MCPKISFNISQSEFWIKYIQLLFLSRGEERKRNSKVRATERVLPVEQILQPNLLPQNVTSYIRFGFVGSIVCCLSSSEVKLVILIYYDWPYNSRNKKKKTRYEKSHLWYITKAVNIFQDRAVGETEALSQSFRLIYRSILTSAQTTILCIH